jgi:GntR family transcriptional regulator, arabinose operon transcriptional repressor
MTKYEKLADKIRSMIMTGVYKAGNMIPSEFELVETERLSRQTVRQALAVLEREGRISRRRGSGSVVLDNAARRDKTNNVAVVTTYISEYIFPDILRGIEQVLSQNGYTPFISATYNRVDNERDVLNMLLTKPIDGIIIEGTKTALPNPNIDLYHSIKKANIPMVFINGYYPEFKPAVYVVADDRAGGTAAVRLLLGNGRKNIAGIFKSDDIQGHRRYAGYAEALREAKIGVRDEHILWYTTETRKKLIGSALLDILADCDAVVCYNDEIAIQVLDILKENGICVPETIAVASFDGSVFSTVSSPKLTSLLLKKEEVGRIAAVKLINLMKGFEEKPYVIPWIAQEREST